MYILYILVYRLYRNIKIIIYYMCKRFNCGQASFLTTVLLFSTVLKTSKGGLAKIIVDVRT